MLFSHREWPFRKKRARWPQQELSPGLEIINKETEAARSLAALAALPSAAAAAAAATAPGRTALRTT